MLLIPLLRGNSFCAIQWGFGAATCPWRLADWMEEIQNISRQWRCTFSHVLRKANGVVNGLAREGVSG